MGEKDEIVVSMEETKEGRLAVTVAVFELVLWLEKFVAIILEKRLERGGGRGGVGIV